MKGNAKILKLARKSILKLVPYSSARSEFSEISGDQIYLDANENTLGSAVELPYVKGELNRYPDPLHTEMRKKLAEIKKIKPEQIFIGNGSDEAIDLLLRVFCEPSKDSILITPPTYGMYQVIADVQSVNIKKAPLDSEYQLDLPLIKKNLKADSKILFICNPNNPTGNAYNLKQIEELIKAAKGIVVVDEAYIDFSEQKSAISLLPKYQNLVILQTMSKAWGMAGARIGFAYANTTIINLLNKIKFPYNLSAMTQSAGLEALHNAAFLERSIKEIVEERERLAEALTFSEHVRRVYPSDANFLLVKFDNAAKAYQKFISNGVVTRDRSSTPGCENCIRISIGDREENNTLLKALGIKVEDSDTTDSRQAVYHRKTKETDIKVTLSAVKKNVSVQSGLGFLDHMLTLFAVHSGLGLKLVCKGDLHVDAHHSVEDCAIALGTALRQMLLDCKGIERYGFYLPMDEASSQVAVDISGRNHLEWNVVFSGNQIGQISASLFKHFFKSFSDAAKITLHIQAKGEDDHHVIEAVFKAVARALKVAISKNSDAGIPSSKGIL